MTTWLPEIVTRIQDRTGRVAYYARTGLREEGPVQTIPDALDLLEKILSEDSSEGDNVLVDGITYPSIREALIRIRIREQYGFGKRG